MMILNRKKSFRNVGANACWWHWWLPFVWNGLSVNGSNSQAALPSADHSHLPSIYPFLSINACVTIKLFVLQKKMYWPGLAQEIKSFGRQNEDLRLLKQQQMLAKLIYSNFQPLEVVSRYRDPHIRLKRSNLRRNIYKAWCLNSHFIPRNKSHIYKLLSYFLFWTCMSEIKSNIFWNFNNCC